MVPQQKIWQPYSRSADVGADALVALARQVARTIAPEFDPPLGSFDLSTEGGDQGDGYYLYTTTGRCGAKAQGFTYKQDEESVHDGVTPSPTDLIREITAYGMPPDSMFSLSVRYDFHGPGYAHVKMAGPSDRLQDAESILNDYFNDQGGRADVG